MAKILVVEDDLSTAELLTLHLTQSGYKVAHAFNGEEAIEKARGQVADLIGASPAEIVFTSGATESNHTAILGALAARDWRPMHHDKDFAVNRNGTRDIFLNTPNLASWFERYARSFSGTIAGGSQEVQNNIISKRILALPEATQAR